MKISNLYSPSKVYPFLLLLILGAIFYANYTPGTWLTGWDNLHPEFNFGLNIQRAFHSVWQEYQGLGLLAGMAHASDLFRTIFLWLLSPIIPDHLSRYFYHFLMLASGTLGVYFFLKNFLFRHFPLANAIPASFLGALFYLLNLGSIQYFYVPFEPYSTFWGLLPWELYTLFLYLEKPNRTHLLRFAFVNFLAIAQAYVQTIFFVYSICVGIILLIYYIKNRTKAAFHICVRIISVIFILNAFWILPQMYFVISDLSVTKEAMQNRMATEKFFQMNKQRGTIDNFIYLKEFYYDFLDTNLKTGKTEFMMQTWRNHFEQPQTLVIGFLFFIIVILGLFSKHKQRMYILALFGLAAFGFLSDTPIIAQLNAITREIPIINQILRNPFTKLIVPTVLVLALSFGLGIIYIFQRIKNRIFIHILTGAFTICFILYVLPAFQGEYISPRMRVTIPDRYFQLFEYLKQQDKNARIMNLPQGGYWGWYLYNWGARGSGFLWYGIEQPIMDRAFDVWSDELEGYYWELGNALRKHDTEAINTILDKYAITYVLYDESLLNSDPFNPVKLAYKQQELLDNNPYLTLEKEFGSVKLYSAAREQSIPSVQILSGELPVIKKDEPYAFFDTAYRELGNYSHAVDDNFNYYFPFETLFTSRFADELPVTITENDTMVQLSSTIPAGDYTLTIPSYTHHETLMPVSISARRVDSGTYFYVESIPPAISVSGKPVRQIPVYSKEFLVQNTEDSFLISINNRDSFVAENLDSTLKPIGNAYFFMNGIENTVKIYSRDKASSLPLLIAHFAAPHICGDIKGEPIAAVKRTNSSLTLEARNTAVCQVYGSAINFTTPSLVEMNFTYRSENDEFPRYCFFSKMHRGCLNNKDAAHYGFTPNKEIRFTDRFEFFTLQNDNLYPQLIIEALRDEDKNKIKKITYKNISVISYPLVHTETIQSIDPADQVSQNVTISTTQPVPITIQIPKLTTSFDYDNMISANMYKKTAFTYDNFMNGEYSLKEKTRQEGKYLEIASQRSSSYLLFQAPDIPLAPSYLLTLETRKKQGLPLNINIFTNKGLRNVTYSSIENTEKEFSKDYRIIPSGYAFDNGLSILLDATAYTQASTKHDIASVSIHPIPHNFISHIQLKRTNSLPTEQSIVATEVDKKNVYRYTVTVSATTAKHIILHQAYHPGWKAVYGCRFLMIGCTFLNHREINSWANGWELPKEFLENPSQPRQITIFYWPQYLEYLGLLTILSPLLLRLLFNKKVHDRAHKRDDIMTL